MKRRSGNISHSNRFYNMKSVVLSLILTIFACAIHGGEDDWKELRVTYSTNKDDKFAFNKMPFYSKDAVKAGWKLQVIVGSDGGCAAGTGYLYSLDNDPAVILIYSENGKLVGLKTGFRESEMKSDQLIAWYKQQPMFEVLHFDSAKHESLYTLHVYFTDPDHVCDKDMKYVSNLYYYNGTQKFLIPHEESKLPQETWQKAKCLPGKGVHYYHGMTKDMNCDNVQPLFLMYHNSTLVAFSFLGFGQFSSPRYGIDEYHPSTQYSHLVDVVPECLYKLPYNLTTFHGYFIEKPWAIDCPK